MRDTPAAAHLREALALFGPNGEHWTQGSNVGFNEHGKCWCANGAVQHAVYAPYGTRSVSRSCLEETNPTGTLLVFNDHPDRTFPEIRDWFLRAIEHANKPKEN